MPVDEDGRGLYDRGYLPHIDRPGLVQFVTFRLMDSVPARLVDEWGEELASRWPASSDSEAAREVLQARVERYADAGYGECLLRDPRTASVVGEALRHFDGLHYRLLAWVVMPNHVHVVIETVAGHPLAAVVGRWKSFSAQGANRVLSRRGPFWKRDYYDRWVRDERHLARVVSYVEANPVVAGLVSEPWEWQFGSAWGRRE